jgi:hypothetical protein
MYPADQAISLVAPPCAILQFMSADISADYSPKLQRRIAGWSARLRALGLDGLVGVLLDATEPISPLGAQLLWVAQPVVSLIMPSDEVDGLARVLDDPAGMAWLRAALTGAANED